MSKRNLEGRKPVVQYDFDGNIIKEYLSVRDAARENNYDRKSIIKNCRAENQHAYHYLWTYKGDKQTLNILMDKVKNRDNIIFKNIPVNVYDLSNNLIFCFDSIKQASVELKKDYRYIQRRVQGYSDKKDVYIFKCAEKEE